jgi:hypothetical protein
MKMVLTTTSFAATCALTLLAGTTSLHASDSALWAAMADGGKAVMLQPAQTEEATPEESVHLSPAGDCTEEQSLSPEAREQARALGKLFDEHGVTVDVVLSSEFCRARQMAELTFGRYETWTPLNALESLPAGESEALMGDIRDRMAVFAGEGVLVLVSHRSNIDAVTFRQTEPGDIVVTEPHGFGGFDVLGVITQE